MLYLSPSALRQALPIQEAIQTMRLAFGPDREQPLRFRVGGSLMMPGRVGRYTGVKLVSVVPGNPAGLVIVCDERGHPLGLVDGPTLTALRTGAASGLATQLLAPSQAKTLAMLGAGAMAADQVAAVRSVRPITRVLCWSRTHSRAAALANAVGGEATNSAEAAVREADVICTATPSRSPLFNSDAVRDGTHLNAIGAFLPDMVEIPSEVVLKAFVVVDDREAAAVEAGDLIQAVRQPDATVGELLAGLLPPRGRTTLFKSVGIASQDVAAATAALVNAEQKGIGIRLD